MCLQWSFPETTRCGVNLTANGICACVVLWFQIFPVFIWEVREATEYIFNLKSEVWADVSEEKNKDFIPAPVIPDLIVLLALSEPLQGLRQIYWGLERAWQGAVRGWAGLLVPLRSREECEGWDASGWTFLSWESGGKQRHFSDTSGLRRHLMSFLFAFFFSFGFVCLFVCLVFI